MKNKIVYLALGSNIEPDKNVKLALKELAKIGKIISVSKFIKTKPEGYLNQADFLNGAIKFQTNLMPQNLLKELKNIEHFLKRNTPFRNGPRTIDIDIIFYGNLILKTPNLIIPHPRADKRFFVLKPLSEIAPNKTHPIFKKQVKTLLKELK
ncbi:MAG: 2-amino-4-hydroxy-6-hydroxymethyldihydropteridine diphosphokinase [Elusimicrobiaceae bacterium]|nr:2-amino-4-hydroxy-6-hydroxymethyldihydropteridine diphosphokinase [Elusimicrobiaceae bacterium]